MRLEFDPVKAAANLAKHGLRFEDAWLVLESRYRLDVQVVRGGEQRTQSLSYVLGYLAALTVVHTPRGDAVRVISFRRASAEESEAYRDWLEEDIE
jgi:uncharacterized DUF497 family protein